MVSYMPKSLVGLRRSDHRFVILLPYPGLSMLLLSSQSFKKVLIQKESDMFVHNSSNKRKCSEFKSFSYLYDEEHLINSLKNDVIIVKELPPKLKDTRKRKECPIFKPKNSASPEYYVKEVLPKLKKGKIIGLVIIDGGCLQMLLLR